MNDQDLHDIEERLSAMRPAEPSPAVKQRIEASLREEAAPGAWWIGHHRIGLAVAAAVLLAGVIGLVLLVAPPKPTDPPPFVSDPPGPPAPEAPDQATTHEQPLEPTLLAFNNAMRESPEDVDQLLDEFSATRFTRLTGKKIALLTATNAWQSTLAEELP